MGDDVPYAAMGGITGFSSLAEGYMRLDDSGIGRLSRDQLEKPIGEIPVIISSVSKTVMGWGKLFLGR